MKLYTFSSTSEETGRPVFRFRFCVSGLLYLVALIAVLVFAVYVIWTGSWFCTVGYGTFGAHAR